ncbi:hypothetical protein ACFQ8E_07515 [Isoptericola sp. NPDC056573]|uniref:YxiG-like protein n=1 Tax=Isoptericola sp. NPDC056573 TaxID=3345868 RepID=UPI0036CBCDDC
MNRQEISAALEDVFDQAIVFHGFARHMRDYDIYVYATADARAGVRPEHLRYRFTHCVRATATTAVPASAWKESLDDRFVDYQRWLDDGAPDGYVWGVNWQALYPGFTLMEASADADRWTSQLGIPFHHVGVETNGHNLELVFADLVVSRVEPGDAPFVVAEDGPDAKIPLP